MSKRKPTKAQLKALVTRYETRIDECKFFCQQVATYFQTSRHFQEKPLPLIHSIKYRVKNSSHLEEKILRKWEEGEIKPDDLFEKITDLAGVRVLHLHTQQFGKIHQAIINHINNGFWVLNEKPTAYSWDPEAIAYFQSLGLQAVTRETYYTSIHYVVKPHADTDLTCEIQVRTLFEEIWGEIDHALNYPKKTEILACKEQLRVLAKLSSTGTRLADSIFKIAEGS